MTVLEISTHFDSEEDVSSSNDGFNDCPLHLFVFFRGRLRWRIHNPYASHEDENERNLYQREHGERIRLLIWSAQECKSEPLLETNNFEDALIGEWVKGKIHKIYGWIDRSGSEIILDHEDRYMMRSPSDSVADTSVGLWACRLNKVGFLSWSWPINPNILCSHCTAPSVKVPSEFSVTRPQDLFYHIHAQDRTRAVDHTSNPGVISRSMLCRTRWAFYERSSLLRYRINFASDPGYHPNFKFDGILFWNEAWDTRHILYHINHPFVFLPPPPFAHVVPHFFEVFNQGSREVWQVNGII